ncbi:MAG: hypothetical protein WC752_03750 [Patescibacteria group bacterium]|jgi:hypothetical protein
MPARRRLGNKHEGTLPVFAEDRDMEKREEKIFSGFFVEFLQVNSAEEATEKIHSMDSEQLIGVISQYWIWLKENQARMPKQIKEILELDLRERMIVRLVEAGIIEQRQNHRLHQNNYL